MYRLPILPLATAILTSSLPAQQALRSYPELTPRIPGFITLDAALADFDSDGNLDVAFVGISGQASLIVLLGEGTGRFLNWPFASVAGAPVSPRLFATDLNGDGLPDLLLGGANTVLLNRGGARFEELPNALPIGATGSGNDLALVDIDSDGDLDLVTPLQQASNGLYLNNGSGRFTNVSARLTPDGQITDTVATGDVNGDGHVDIVFSGRGTSRPGLSRRGEVKLYFGDGQGNFVDSSAGRVPALDLQSRTSQLRDLDGNGTLDLLIVDAIAGLVLLAGDGSGNFTEVSTRLPAGTGFAGLDAATLDVNEDGFVDLLYGASAGLQLLLGTSEGSFQLAPSASLPPLVAGLQNILTSDLDRDGDEDVLFASTNILTGANNDAWFNQHRQVDAAAPPTRGNDWVLEVGHRPAATPSLGVAFPLLSPDLLATPLGPFGVLGLDPATTLDLAPIRLTGGAGHTELRIPVPDVPGIAGTSVAIQALILEPLRGARFTNVWVGTVR